MVSTNSSYRLIMIALALLVQLLLPAAKASDSEPPYQQSVPVLYESCYLYGPPNITENSPRKKIRKKNKYVVNVKSFDQTLDVEPVFFNLTVNIDKRLPEGRAVIQLIPLNNGEWITRNVDLCSLTRGGCPIHHGNFTVSFDLSFHGFYQVQFSMFAKTGELLTCVFFQLHGPLTVPDEPTPAPSESYEPPTPSGPYEPTPAPSKAYEPILAPSKPYEPTPAPSESHEPVLAPSEPYEPTPAPSEAHEPTQAPSESYEPTPTPLNPSEPTSAPPEPPIASEPPSQLLPVWVEDCGEFGPPNITANPPENITYHVWMRSFYMTLYARPLFAYDLTYELDKILPAGRAVTQIMPANTGKTKTLNEDLCGYIRGGCPVLPGEFVVSFNVTVDYFTEFQFSMFTEDGELLQCVYFEAS